MPQWNQLISGSNYIYYVVEYIIKNVMEIFFHSVLIFFFLSLINKVKIRQGLFLSIKNYMLHNNSGSFFQKKNQLLEIKCSPKRYLPWIFSSYFLLTSAFGHPPLTHLVSKHQHLATPNHLHLCWMVPLSGNYIMEHSEIT